ncbi:hypothetical protein [Streptomyces sp. CBMA123]|uniref:hypothetical protein n=1 Tax=Streptomyces sp. CBMA123 TaxID=1896313 RepID=UPI001661F899|nr:hypothetical protein [Streptomyces sp. CBMA123]MBD0694605.1 hypothetical protein [Streptomyces sp. CBMA123]
MRLPLASYRSVHPHARPPCAPSGHQIGWVERGLAGIGDRRVAVYEGYFIGDVHTQEVMLHDTPEQAAFTVHTAHPSRVVDWLVRTSAPGAGRVRWAGQ